MLVVVIACCGASTIIGPVVHDFQLPPTLTPSFHLPLLPSSHSSLTSFPLPLHTPNSFPLLFSSLLTPSPLFSHSSFSFPLPTPHLFSLLPLLLPSPNSFHLPLPTPPLPPFLISLLSQILPLSSSSLSCYYRKVNWHPKQLQPIKSCSH